LGREQLTSTNKGVWGTLYAPPVGSGAEPWPLNDFTVLCGLQAAYFCYVFKEKQLQKSINLTERGCANPRGQKLYEQSGLSPAAGGSGVNASSRLAGRTTEWDGCGEGNTPPHTSLRLSERRATNIGLLYPKVRNNIGGYSR